MNVQNFHIRWVYSAELWHWLQPSFCFSSIVFFPVFSKYLCNNLTLTLFLLPTFFPFSCPLFPLIILLSLSNLPTFVTGASPTFHSSSRGSVGRTAWLCAPSSTDTDLTSLTTPNWERCPVLPSCFFSLFPSFSNFASCRLVVENYDDQCSTISILESIHSSFISLQVPICKNTINDVLLVCDKKYVSQWLIFAIEMSNIQVCDF